MNEEQDPPMMPPPPSSETKILRDAYFTQKTKQADIMDDLAKELIKLEIAIPGIYATILKFLDGSDADAPESPWLFAVFGLWGLSLAFAIASLIPRNWNVDTQRIKGVKMSKDASLSIEGFFTAVAQHKQRRLIGSIACFFLGLMAAAALTIFQ